MTSWFDESPETYDRARPSYPEPLWDELFRRLPPAPSIVEIGPGTGKATAALLKRGAHVVACEPGENLANYLRTRFAGAALDVRTTSFEAARFEGAQFDALVAATSFHWVDPLARAEKAPSLVKPGGYLAIVATNQVQDAVDRGYFAASQPIYNKHFPGDPPDPPQAPGRDLVPPEFAELRANPALDQPELFRYDWDQRYTTEQYLDLVRSYSNTAQMALPARAAFLDDLAVFIDREFEGYVIRPLVITLSLARRRV